MNGSFASGAAAASTTCFSPSTSHLHPPRDGPELQSGMSTCTSHVPILSVDLIRARDRIAQVLCHSPRGADLSSSPNFAYARTTEREVLRKKVPPSACSFSRPEGMVSRLLPAIKALEELIRKQNSNVCLSWKGLCKNGQHEMSLQWGAALPRGVSPAIGSDVAVL